MIASTPSLLLGPAVHYDGILSRAMGAAADRVGRDGVGFLAVLRAGDPRAHSAFRYALAQEFCRYVSRLGSTFRAVYVYGSTVDGRTRPSSDVDIIAWVFRKSDTVESLLLRLNHLLTQGYRALTGCQCLQQLFDIHLVDDEDVEFGRAYGAVVRSVWTAPLCLWRR
ncbi:hypothetical protein H5T55_05205 [Candidatus Bipolaricaulota bacterium]|nr:hypothetical protein [Candidatus Bipolaricaulota bacterium]